MRILRDPYRFESNERWSLLVLAVAMLYVAILAVMPVGSRLPPLCPMRLFGCNCPGCGMTRACASLMQLSLWQALAYNPLVLLVAPYVAYRVARLGVGLTTGRELVTGWPPKFLAAYQWTFAAGALCLGVLRLASWAWPECNPLAVGLPPSP